MRDHATIYINGRRHLVPAPALFQPLADFLRRDLGLTGTKIVCAEGDCGSCAVLAGRPGDRGGDIRYESVCSCIRLVGQADGSHIVTIEGLGHPTSPDEHVAPGRGELNPVQESMVSHHGSQCGFCTPGFVVSLYNQFERGAPTTNAPARIGSEEVRSACIGNLCRCTGYEPILRAAVSVDPSGVRPLNTLYPPSEVIVDLSKAAGADLHATSGDCEYFRPAALDSAVEYRRDHPDCTILAGGTDLGVQVNKHTRKLRKILDLGGIAKLRQIEVVDNAIVCGATASIHDLERAAHLALPEYGRLLNLFGSPLIRHAGTVGGNIANASPIGDSMPAMYVLDAAIELTSTSGSRWININEFYTGYKQSVARPNELITAVRIPLPSADDVFKLYKVSKRRDLDISAFTAAFRIRRCVQSGAIESIRIAYGGVGPNIVRLSRTEEFLKGRVFTLDVACEAGRIARREVVPISDVRGGAKYRSQLAENMPRKLYHDLDNDRMEEGHRSDDCARSPEGNGSPPRIAGSERRL